MSKLIVDFFKMAQIENDNSEGVSIGFGAFYLLLKALLAETASMQARKWIQN